MSTKESSERQELDWDRRGRTDGRDMGGRKGNKMVGVVGRAGRVKTVVDWDGQRDGASSKGG